MTFKMVKVHLANDKTDANTSGDCNEQCYREQKKTSSNDVKEERQNQEK